MPRSAEPLPAAGPPVEVSGTLGFSLESPGGATTGTVVGSGRRVVVHTDDPVAALRAAAAPGPGRTAVGGLAELLAGSGLRVEVTGPRGTVAALGDGVDSPLGRFAAGSRHVRLGRPAAVRPLALAQARSVLAGHRGAGLVLVAVALAVLRRAARRR